MKCFTRVLVLTILAGWCASTPANIINVDISGFNVAEGDTGPGFTGNGVLRSDFSTNTNPALGASSGLWNNVLVAGAAPNVTIPPVPVILDSGGNLTGLSFSLAGWIASDDFSGGPYGGSNDLLQDYLVQLDGGGPATLTITGLPASRAHDLYLYATNDGADASAVVSVNGSAPQVSTGTGGIYTLGGNYLAFLGVNTDALGQLVVTVTGETANLGIINGFQVVPEPSSCLFLALGTVGLITSRRRRMIR